MTPEDIKDRLKHVEIIDAVQQKGCDSHSLVYNTTKHQLVSLDLFAKMFGYERLECINTYVPCKPYREVKGMSFINLNTMVKWHNTGFACETHPTWRGIEHDLPKRSEKLGICLGDMIDAMNARLYKKVYLQRKKNGDIITQKHILEFW